MDSFVYSHTHGIDSQHEKGERSHHPGGAGKLEAGESLVEFRDLAKRLTSDGGRLFILNLAGVSHMDSSGLGLLLSVYATIRNQGGDLKLLNVGERVKELLRVTNLIGIFEIFEDEDHAIAGKIHQA